MQNLASEFALLSPQMKEAFFAALDAYEKTGVRFMLIGGLAAGSYSESRATRDIDFMVGDEAFSGDRGGSLLMPRFIFPHRFGPIPIDLIPMPDKMLFPELWEVLNASLSRPHVDTSLGRPVPIVSALALAYMKLAVGRFKDKADILALIESGAVSQEELFGLVKWFPDQEISLREILGNAP